MLPSTFLAGIPLKPSSVPQLGFRRRVVGSDYGIEKALASTRVVVLTTNGVYFGTGGCVQKIGS